jgi:DNA segregation ATPase FtsK/SpoIIIE, S-DNA-T family
VNRAMSISETGDLLQEFRAAAARLQEEKLRMERETAQRKTSLASEAEAALQRLQAGQAAERQRISGELGARASHWAERTAQRKARITKAHTSSRKAALARIDEKEGRRKFAVQKGILETEKGRDARVAELEREFQDYSAAWQEEQRQLGLQREVVRKSLAVYWTFPGLLNAPVAEAETSQNRTAAEFLEEVRSLRSRAHSELGRFRSRVLPVFFRFFPIWLWWLIGIGLFFAGPARLGLGDFSETQFRQIVGGVVGGLTILYFIGWALSAPVARSLAGYLRKAEQALELGYQAAEGKQTGEIQQTKMTSAERVAAFQQEWESAISDATAERAALESRMEARVQNALRRNEQLHAAFRSGVDQTHSASVQDRDRADEAARQELRDQWDDKIRKLETELTARRNALETEWKQVSVSFLAKLEESRKFAAAHFQPWSDDQRYEPRESSLDAVKFGQFRLDLPSPFNGPAERIELSAPLSLVLPAEASVFIETDEAGRAEAIHCLNNIVYRVLQTVPPGKAAFTFVDPVHLGQSFSSIMHLADFEENIVHRRIWTEPAEIEERLLELNAHMEKVIQMYLRNEFRDIVEYNKEAGRIAEKYHFLVLADFPANFSDTAMRRLLKIAASGARCGVYLLIHCDKRLPLPPGFETNDLIQSSIHIQANRQGIVIPRLGRGAVQFDAPPEAEIATRFLQQVGEASRGSNTVQVPFGQIAPAEKNRWSLETTEELRVPIGRSGANKLQYFTLGKGTRQHVLIAGKTGSGKSTLFHVLITNLALWSSPEQVEFYLVDFKKGVEFKDYATAKLPHARVIAIESDREFGLSVLRRVDEELRVRGELFRGVGAQDLAGYKRASRNGRMPRVLLIIDEFQELFVEDDAIAQNAALLLDRIVRQGRAFGIHVVLGSQTLGGAYSLARSTLGQMVVRIALQCNEADAYLIMDENNPAPRLLSRPGEGIYNDSGGIVEANSPFQVVWLSEAERRAALQTVRSLAEQKGERNEPIVFEGNSLAELEANTELAAALSAPPGRPPEGQPKIWLGLPNEIKGPTHVVLDQRTGRNLLVAGQHDDHVRALLAAAILSLAAQNRMDAARFVLLETPAAGSSLSLAGIAARLPHETRVVKGSEIAEVFRSLAEEIDRRESGTAGPRIYLLVHNLSAFKALRPEDEFSVSFEEGKASPAADFQKVYTEGPVHGIHVIAQVDGFNNANRFLGRKGLKEFSARVLFQMSASDSASLADDPRAGNLGLNRALLYDEQEGTYETFRPYARPSAGWLAEVEEKLRAANGAGQPLPTDVAHPRIVS